MNENENLRRPRPRTAGLPLWRVAAESFGVSALALLALIPYLSQRTFLDEFDNMIGGNVVAQGGAIYVDFFSQHTPVAYWISALGQLLGANYFGGQRLWGYVVFALLLGVIYGRNVRSFGRLPMLTVAIGIPLLHAFNPELSYTVLSDNYQAIAFASIVFDVVAIGLLRERGVSRWVSLGFASALAIGVAFVAVYFVAGALVVTTVLVIVDMQREAPRWRVWAMFISARAGVFILPFVLIFVALVLTGALRGAYEQAFVLNRDYYSQYISGFGSDPVSPLYSGIFDFALRFGGLPQLFQSSPLIALRNAAAILVVAAATITFARLRTGLGIGLLWLAALCATRGWDGFHAQPFWAFVISCVGLLAWATLRALKTPLLRSRPLALIGGVALCALGLGAVAPYATMVWQQRNSLLEQIAFPNPDRTKVIETLVPVGGSYGELNVNNAYDFVETRRLPAGGVAGVVPWFGDALDSQIAQRLSADNPVLVFSDPVNDVWGYNVLDHIPEVVDVITDHYTEIDMTDIGLPSGVYIRNDVLYDSLDQLESVFPGANFAVSQRP